jgi:hypothetical protein
VHCVSSPKSLSRGHAVKVSFKVIICVFITVLLIFANVYAIFWATWQAPVTVRVGTLTPYSTNIYVRCEPSSIGYGETTTIRGKLVNATDYVGIPDQTITLYYRPAGDEAWIYTTSVSTAYDGTFSYLWSGSADLLLGFYIVNATFLRGAEFDPWTGITDFQVRAPNQPPNKPTAVSQYRSDGVTVIPEGGTTPESTVVFKGTVSDPDGDNVRLEIELRQIGEPFTGEPTPETISYFVPSGTQVTITRYGLVNADYKWQYRAKDSNGATSNWTEFGTPENIDFRVQVEDQSPTCSIKLQKDSVEISEIDVGQFFDIYAGGSIDDTGIKQVRFSSDDLQDGNPTGEWTGWYAWDISSGDWDASTKIKRWSFATCGKKEVWAEVKDDISQTDRRYANIFVHPGYAIIVAGNGQFKSAIDHSANNAYRVLRNLGFDDDHIFYLNSKRPQDVDGDEHDEVDKCASFTDFYEAVLEITAKMGGNPTPFILYLVGHGNRGLDDPELYSFEFVQSGEDPLFSSALNSLLNLLPSETPMLIVLGSCYSGGFITSNEGSISAPNRIIITATHDDWIFGRVNFFDLAWFSDRFWGKLNKGYNIKEAFSEGISESDIHHRWLDDNGDMRGNSPNRLEDDGELSARTNVGVPGTENWKLKRWLLVREFSSVELRVYDLQNRVTGLVNGTVKEEIPDSIYDEENEALAIFSPLDISRYEVAGTHDGIYGLEISFIDGSEATSFTATDIPTLANATHQYAIDWVALSLGEEGVTVKVDSDGDGVFEHTFTSDSQLTQSEYLSALKPVGGIWIPVNKLELLAPYIGLTILLAVAVSTAVYLKKRKRNTEIISNKNQRTS